MSFALRCVRSLRPAGIQLRSASVIDLHQGQGERANNMMRAQVKEYNGFVYIDLRHYFKPEEEPSKDFLPTKKGITMTIEQFDAVVEALPQLREMIKDESKNL